MPTKETKGQNLLKNQQTADTNVAPLPIRREYTPHELVHGLQVRDRAASAAFFDKYNNQVNRLVRRFLGPDDEHVDIVNTVFVEILNSIDRIKEPQALTRWVSTITIHVVRGEIRKRKYKRLFFKFTETPDEYVASVNGNQDTLSRIYRTLKSLGANEQIVFVLHYLEGYTYEEIAEIEKISIATAKRRGQKCKSGFIRKMAGDQELSQFVEELKNV